MSDVAFQCSGCYLLFCFCCGTKIPDSDPEIEVKTIGSKYCSGCVEVEARAHGLTVEAMKSWRDRMAARPMYKRCHHLEART